MNADAKEILRLLKDPQAIPSEDWVEQLSESHPAFALPAALMLKRGKLLDDPDRRQELVLTAMMRSSDHTAMADFADITADEWEQLYPPRNTGAQKSTNDVIQDFLQTFSHGSSPEEDALLEKLIFQPTAPDYFAGLDAPYNPGDPLQLPAELQETPTAAYPETPAEQPSAAEAALQAQKSGEEAEITHEEPMLRESLAKIYIKQRRYERAFEIINDLSLKYPEKSAYFADQLRFLQKLIINKRNCESRKKAN